jgi:hypothetical protein
MPDQVELKVDVLTSGGDRLDQLVTSVQNIERALTSAAPPLQNIENQLKSVGEQTNKTSAQIKEFGESVRNFIENPVNGAGAAISGLLEKIGPLGVGLAATGGVIAAMGTMAFESAKSLGDLGTQISNISIRTGLSSEEVGKFSYAAKLAGGDITTLEMGMRMLSRALADNSEEGARARKTLADVGITATDMFGNVKPTSELLLELSNALNKMSTPAERSVFMMNAMGRAGTELLPMILQLRENINASANAEVFTQKQLDDMKEMSRRVAEAEESWKKLGTAIKEVAAQAFVWTSEHTHTPSARELIAGAGLGPLGDIIAGASGRGMLSLNQGQLLSTFPGGAAPSSDIAFAPLIAAGNALFAGDARARLVGDKSGPEAQLKLAEQAESEAWTKYKATQGPPGHPELGQVDSVVRPAREEWEKFATALKAAREEMESFNVTQENLKQAQNDIKTLDIRNSAIDISGLTGPDKLRADLANELDKYRAHANAPGVDAATRSQELGGIATAEGINANRVGAAQTKYDQEGRDRTQHIIDQMRQEGTSQQIQQAGRMAALDQGADPNQIAFNTRTGLASAQSRGSISQADATFAREDAAATTTQEHDDAAKHRMDAYWNAAREYQKEYRDASGELAEKNKKDDNDRTEALKKQADELDRIARHTVTDDLVKQLEHVDKIATASAGPGQEGAAVNSAYQTRLAVAQAVHALETEDANKQYARDSDGIENAKTLGALQDTQHKQLAEADKKAADAAYDAQEQRQLKLLEMQAHALESFRSAAGGIFDAMTGKDPGKAMQEFFIGKAKDLGRGVFENMAESIFPGVENAATLPGQTTADGTQLTGIGQMLKGTFAAGNTQQHMAMAGGIPGMGGASGTALPANTSALGMATNAIRDLTAVIGHGMGFGSGTTGGGGGGTDFSSSFLAGGGAPFASGSQASLDALPFLGGGASPMAAILAAAGGSTTNGARGSLSSSTIWSPGGMGAGVGGFTWDQLAPGGGTAGSLDALPFIGSGGTGTDPISAAILSSAIGGGGPLASMGGGGSLASIAMAGGIGGSSSLANMSSFGAGASLTSGTNDFATATSYVAAATKVAGLFAANGPLASLSTPGTSSTFGQFGQGVASVMSGNGLEAATATGSYGLGGANSPTESVYTQIGAGVGLAGATYAGVTTALKDFSKGGGQGISAGIGAIAGTAALYDPEPISHMILSSVAAVSSIVSSLFGDPKQERQAAINHELQNDSYNSTGYIDSHGNFVPGSEPKSISYYGASTGASYDTNFQGGIRGGSFASTTRDMYDPSSAANQLRNGYLPPPAGTWIDRGIGYGDQADNGGPTQRPTTANGVVVGQTPQQQALQQVIVQVSAMDSKSFLDNAANISNALRKGIQMGHPVVQEIQQAVNPR